MKIGIDIDNVIANTFQDLVPHFNQFVGQKMEPIQVIQFMRRRKLKMLGYYLNAWKNRIMTTVTLIDGAAETIRQWYQAHNIKLITSRMPLFNQQTRYWLKKHNIPFHELHHAKEMNKYKKADGCQIFIEDNIEESEILADHCERILLLDHPWNRRKPCKSNIIRVKNWQEIKLALDTPLCC